MLLLITFLFAFGNVESLLIDSGVYVIDPKGQVLRHLSARSALFGPDIPDKGISGHIVYASPPDACSQIAPAPKVPNNHSNWIVLIRRSDCSFVQKVRNAQAAGFVAAIVHSADSDMLVPMSGEVSGTVTIPSVFVGITSANTLLKYNFSMSHKVLLETLDFNYIKFLWPFILVLTVCMSVLLLFTVVKCVVNQIKKFISRVSPSALRKLPIKKFRKGDRYDTCAICLEDYESGDRLRLLPCSHTFHKKCIDPWLTKNKRTCPLCKKKAIERPRGAGANQSDSDDSVDDVLVTGPSSERTPLLAGRTTVTTQSLRSTYGVGIADARNVSHNVEDAVDQVGSSGVEVHRASSPDSVIDESNTIDLTGAERVKLVELSRESAAGNVVLPSYESEVVVVIETTPNSQTDVNVSRNSGISFEHSIEALV